MARLCHPEWRGRRLAGRWRLALVVFTLLAGLGAVRPLLAASCEEAPLMLVHPALSDAYEPIIAQLVAGLTPDNGSPPGVCAVDALSPSAESDAPRQVVAVGEHAYAAARQAFPRAQVQPILVRTLPATALQGLSRFVAPALVIAELRALSPASETLVFVHRRTVPERLIQQAHEAAQAQGLGWETITVGDLREAALAIERIRQAATPTRAIWVHRDVLSLNPDILIPPLVRRSWEVGFPVISDDADSVERGLLFGLTPDYRALGRAVAVWPHPDHPPGLTDIQWVQRVFNRRTARAIGLVPHPAEETHFDVIFD